MAFDSYRERLSVENRKIQALIAEEKTNSQIAMELGLSVTAVNARIRRMRDKGYVLARRRKPPKNGRIVSLRHRGIQSGSISDTLEFLSEEEFTWLKNQQSPDIPYSLWLVGLIRDAFIEDT